jgi:hypothetical protein
MADIQSNIIQSLTKVSDASQSRYAVRDLPARTPTESQAQALTLNVVSINNNQITLQEHASGKKLVLDKSALQNVANANLAKGDALLLVSSSQKTATFVVERNAQQYPQKLSGNTLQNVALSLNKQWPDLPTKTIIKAHPVVLNQLQIATNTQQTNNLASAIVAIANANGQPSLNVKTIAEAAFIVSPAQGTQVKTVDVSIANALRLNIKNGSGKAFVIDLPFAKQTSNGLSSSVISEFKNMLTNKQTVSVQFNADNKQQLLSKLALGGSLQISKQAISEINQVLNKQYANLKQNIASLVVSPHSSNLHKGIVVSPSMQNLQSLGTSVKHYLTQGIGPSALQNASILVAQSQQKPNQLQVSLIEKPVTINIDNGQLLGVNSKTEKSGKALESGLLRTNQSQLQAQQNGNIGSVGISSAKALGETHANIPSQQLKNQLIEMLTLKGNTQQAVSTKIANLQATIYSVLNQVLPRAESTTQALPPLLEQLSLLNKEAGTELKQLIAQVSEHLKNNIGGSKAAMGSVPPELSDGIDEIIMSQSNRQIKETLGAEILPNLAGLPLQSVSAISNQGGLVNGLVAMLQASLQAKLIAQQPQLLPSILQSTQLAQMLPAILGKGSVSSSHSKLLLDLARLDPRSNLIGEVNKVLSNHSLHKLAGAETSLQSQDSFYYMLPNMFSSHHEDIEIVIRREQENSPENEQKTQQAWQLSMKLDIGKSGDVLAKVKLVDNNLDLNLYASNQALKEKILDYLPHLNSRLETLGLLVKPKCFLGKIPKTLHKTDYQMVQAYV